LLTVAYDGGHYSGFVRQANARTVGGELGGAVSAIDPRATNLRAASRTDAGVHARGQLCAFDSTKELSPRSWVLALTQHLPQEIAVVRAASVAPGFDPRRHAQRKTYRYSVLHSVVRDPFWEGRAWRISERFNQSEAVRSARALLGKHDFRAFRGAEDQREETVRQIFRIDVHTAHSDERITLIDVEGNGFMYKMVRIIAGSLVDIGRGRLAADAFERALESGVRTDLGITAPAQGLCLEEVVLDVDLQDFWP
jgi:tRNA pseudouridine38-40 synthase